MRTAQYPTSLRQRGIALAVALILLILVTLIGLAAIRGTTLQQRMTANFYDRELAFQSAEAALRTGENLVQAITSGASTAPLNDRDCISSHCLTNPFVDPNLDSALIHTTAADDFTAGANGAGQPQYVIELICTDCVSPGAVVTDEQLTNCSGYGSTVCNNSSSSATYYRVTARSGDPSTEAGANRAVVTLQSLVAVPN